MTYRLVYFVTIVRTLRELLLEYLKSTIAAEAMEAAITACKQMGMARAMASNCEEYNATGLFPPHVVE